MAGLLPAGAVVGASAASSGGAEACGLAVALPEEESAALTGETGVVWLPLCGIALAPNDREANCPAPDAGLERRFHKPATSPIKIRPLADRINTLEPAEYLCIAVQLLRCRRINALNDALSSRYQLLGGELVHRLAHIARQVHLLGDRKLFAHRLHNLVKRVLPIAQIPDQPGGAVEHVHGFLIRAVQQPLVAHLQELNLRIAKRIIHLVTGALHR